MIKVAELRIGNLIQYNGNHKEIGIVTSFQPKICFWNSQTSKDIKIGINGRFDIVYDGEKIKPIPLTEEWLKKFDFKKQNSIKHCLLYTVKTKQRQYFSVSEMLDGYEDPNELSLKEIKRYWSFDGNKYDVKIKYVHQLQNLYFALTGEELQLKN